MYIDFSVTNQTLSRTSNDKTVENSQNYWRCRFNFISADWGEVTKAAMFKTPDMEKPVIRLLVDNECDFPNGASRSTCNIALIGGGSEVITALASGTATVRSGMIVTTNTVCIPFEDTLDSDDVDCDLSLPDNDFTEFLSKLNAKITKIDNLQEQIKVDLDSKQDKLTFDDKPTANSTNSVTSGVIKSALDGKVDTLTDDGGFTVGRNANTINGIAIGISATTRRGVAISCEAVAEDDGIAIGEQSLTYGGIAIGHFARTFTYADSGDYIPIDAIQLGEGDNSNPYTMQVYNYQLIACDGSGNKRVNYLKDVGKLSSLATSVKDNIVNAINSIVTLLSQKVDKVDGKGLSANDYTDEDAAKLSALPTKSELNSDLEGKQDKLTFDTAPTANSTNPVMSGAVKTALDGINSKIGDVSHLNSQNVVSAIEELQQYHRQTIEGSELSNMCFNNPMGTYINRIFVLSSASVENKLAANDAIIGVGMDLDNEFTDFVEYENGTFSIYGHVFLKIASALQIGDLTTLQTTEKNNIVGAVNELKTQINALHGFGADFWTGFFKTGRTDFSYAFINNGAAEIKPTQAINATVIKYMLLNCSGLVDASPIVVNLSADNPVVVGVCMGCLKMTTPPVINFTGENAHVCRSYVSAYANCAKLTQCTIWFGDGTQSASGERTDMANTFLNCSALISLTFSGSGSPKSLDLSACKLLSNESIQSLYNALMDVSAVTSGTYKITINSDIQTKITALSLDFAGKGWTLEVKQEETANA